MNKAFVREPDDTRDRCPTCGSIGQPVFQATLVAHLSPVSLGNLSESACFCPLDTCRVAYFDSFERTVFAEDLLHPVSPKDPQAPLCPCFGLTYEDIEADVQEGVVTRVKAHLKRTQSDETQCETKAANGRSCVAAVQKCYMRLVNG